MRTTQATTLDEVYETLTPEPLQTREELAAFYGEGLNKVRGSDKVAVMELGLKRAHGKNFYKAFLMGHSGVGKSTELSRLVHRVQDRYQPIRFDVRDDLDPVNFKPFDVLLLMMIRVVEDTGTAIADGGAGSAPPDQLLQDIAGWFATETISTATSTQTNLQGSAGAGPPAQSLLAKLTGLFAHVKGEIKFVADRKKEVVEYRLSRIYVLIDLLNRLLVDCYDRLRQGQDGREWLFIGESFDKPGVPIHQTEDLFLNYGHIFQDLRAHLVFDIPVGLVHSSKGASVSALLGRPMTIPDTPVYKQDHTPHRAGREALREILEDRISPDLFGPRQMMRLIVASGGNLRDLFAMTSQAADHAILRGGAGKITAADVTRVINEMRSEYEGRLGVGPYDEERVTYDEKADRLVKIYASDPNAQIDDPVLFSLLRARAVQEFNGERWLGVHPLVVDLLHAQGRILPSEGEAVPGGTR